MVDTSITYHKIDQGRKQFDYVVIATRYENKWLWVRQGSKQSWEIPGGHIEENETPEMAAKRELWEETGALDFKLTAICDFAIETNGGKSYNRLFYCEIEKLGRLPESEIEEISLRDTIPELLTHGSIQPRLLEKVLEHRASI